MIERPFATVADTVDAVASKFNTEIVCGQAANRQPVKSGRPMARVADFSPGTKDMLSKRVAMRCSNPHCRQSTSGPTTDPKKAINIGVAAHISAASKSGPRYNSQLTTAERQGADNAIWLCQSCAKLIDNDVGRYTTDLLFEWKRLSEEAARLAIDSPSSNSSVMADVDILKHFAQCFDRPAFQDRFDVEGSMEAFDRAIEDTITALNTGALRARDGVVLASGRGKAYLTSAKWREQMDVVGDLLRAIRSRYRLALKSGRINVNKRSDGSEWYCIYDREIVDWMNETRAEIIGIFSSVASEAGIRTPASPRWNRR